MNEISKSDDMLESCISNIYDISMKTLDDLKSIDGKIGEITHGPHMGDENDESPIAIEVAHLNVLLKVIKESRRLSENIKIQLNNLS